MYFLEEQFGVENDPDLELFEDVKLEEERDMHWFAMTEKDTAIG